MPSNGCVLFLEEPPKKMASGVLWFSLQNHPTNMEVQKGQLTNSKVVFPQSVHFQVSWWEGHSLRLTWKLPGLCRWNQVFHFGVHFGASMESSGGRVPPLNQEDAPPPKTQPTSGPAVPLRAEPRPRAILKSFPCTSASSAQQKPREDKRTMTCRAGSRLERLQRLEGPPKNNDRSAYLESPSDRIKNGWSLPQIMGS